MDDFELKTICPYRLPGLLLIVQDYIAGFKGEGEHGRPGPWVRRWFCGGILLGNHQPGSDQYQLLFERFLNPDRSLCRI